ncbi:MAG: hypothetical protein HY363_05435 [Candidatus Aenigmarchaeota archaeon]|nr:hypothetical protein [Candidatus Aenigmarchaeota archaeon]
MERETLEEKAKTAPEAPLKKEVTGKEDGLIGALANKVYAVLQKEIEQNKITFVYAAIGLEMLREIDKEAYRRATCEVAKQYLVKAGIDPKTVDDCLSHETGSVKFSDVYDRIPTCTGSYTGKIIDVEA